LVKGHFSIDGKLEMIKVCLGFTIFHSITEFNIQSALLFVCSILSYNPIIQIKPFLIKQEKEFIH
jgi:hypothetical protein